MIGTPPAQSRLVRDIFEDIGIYNLEAVKASEDDELTEAALLAKGVKKGVAKLLIKAIEKL